MSETGSQNERVKQEAREVVRCFQRFAAEQRANQAASHRLGHRQREAIGDYFYIHPKVPGRAFTTRRGAACAAVEASDMAAWAPSGDPNPEGTD